MRNPALKTDIRDVILDAAERLMGDFGYQKTTVDEIAREAGVGKGTIYLYFPSKEEVALSCIDRINDRLQDELRAAAESAGSPAERIRTMLITRVLYRFESSESYRKSLDEMLAALRPALLARRVGYHEAEAQIFAEVLDEGRRDGAFSLGDSHAVAHALLLATNSLLPYSLSTRQLGCRQEIEAKAATIADLLLYGLLKR